MSKEQNHIIAGAGDLALDAWGNQKVVEIYSLFHSLFTFDVPIKKWESIVNGVEENLLTSTLCTMSDGKLSVKTAANNGDVTYLHSRRHPQYQSNRGHVYSTSIFIPNPSDNAVEDFGLFTDTDGVFFRVDILGDLYACIQSDGVITHQELIPMPFALDYSKGNVFDIQFQWRGAGNFKFFAGNPKTGKLEFLYIIKNLNKLTDLTILNPSLCAAYRVTSLGDAGEIQSGCVDISTEGGREGREQYQSAESIGKAISGVNVPVLIVKSPDRINGTMNTRDGRLARVSGASDKRSVFTIWFTRDETAFTGEDFKPVGNGSFIESDIVATAVDTAKMSFVTSFRVSANSGEHLENPAKDIIDFFFIHGDYIAVTTTVTSGTSDAVLEWGEEA